MSIQNRFSVPLFEDYNTAMKDIDKIMDACESKDQNELIENECKLNSKECIKSTLDEIISITPDYSRDDIILISCGLLKISIYIK